MSEPAYVTVTVPTAERIGMMQDEITNLVENQTSLANRLSALEGATPQGNVVPIRRVDRSAAQGWRAGGVQPHITPILIPFIAWLYEHGPNPDSVTRNALLAEYLIYQADQWAKAEDDDNSQADKP